MSKIMRTILAIFGIACLSSLSCGRSEIKTEDLTSDLVDKKQPSRTYSVYPKQDAGRAPARAASPGKKMKTKNKKINRTN